MTSDDDRFGPPPIEPLSDVAWARVERGLLARMDSGANPVVVAPRPMRWLWIATPILAIAAITTLVIAMQDAAPVPVAVTPVEGEGTRIVTETTPTSVSFGDAHITVDAASAIITRREAGQPTTLLERGAARFAVAPRANRSPFIVRAGDTTVRVVGTRFRVARSEERVAVDVEHGSVEVQFRGTLVEVREHQTWTSDRPTEVATIAKPTSRSKPVAVATATIDDDPDAIELEPVTAKKKRKPAKPATTAPPPSAAPEPPTQAEPDASSDADRAKFNRLTALEKRDPDRALAGYLQLSQRPGRWSGVALYAAGRLAADRNDPRAETLLTIYVRRFPNGANVDDARGLLARLKGDPR